MISRKTIQMAIISFLLVGLIFTTSSAYAYWQSVTVTEDIEIVTIGQPIEILVTDINEEMDLNLVPSGYALAVGDVEIIELTYEVGVSRELLNTVNLHVFAKDVLINDEDTYSNLVDIKIMGYDDHAILDLYNDDITIVLQVRLIEPIDAEEAAELGLDEALVNVEDSVQAYEDIRGQTITFSLGFELEQKTDEVTE
ncbi:hypothetical protein [Candidatus Xianfuyuplasma coldseepsis]|uniref:Uncharacterized protein n=1 Tax=Candidatus Xianfuyuplasma coldseepsis TaxID=2782163 RepID=A0A7L7KPJ4_9MOLU|nr:hypothetical protein [Xianfuyuplasma coldseepsis]QMS84623.1 hypothetical protein G4Z02_02280 [Xianfuyuplasma coldseepsis]